MGCSVWGPRCSLLLLGVPAEVFQVVTLAPNQRGCVDVHMCFKTHPSTGVRYCLRNPEGASAEENVAQSPLCLHGHCAHVETVPVPLVKSSLFAIVVKSHCFSRVNKTTCHSAECRVPPLLCQTHPLGINHPLTTGMKSKGTHFLASLTSHTQIPSPGHLVCHVHSLGTSSFPDGHIGNAEDKHNPNTQEAEAELHKFQASQGYLVSSGSHRDT